MVLLLKTSLLYFTILEELHTTKLLPEKNRNYYTLSLEPIKYKSSNKIE